MTMFDVVVSTQEGYHSIHCIYRPQAEQFGVFGVLTTHLTSLLPKYCSTELPVWQGLSQ